MRTATIAHLRVELVDEHATPESPLVVLAHGWDGFASDLSPFAQSFALPFRFVCPEAPWKSVGGDREGNAWWPIHDEARRAALLRGEARDLSAIVPPELRAAREALGALLGELSRTYRPSAVVLGGFSQGAMLTLDLTLREARPIDGLVLLSGARICADAWAPLYASRPGLRVFMSHGPGDLELSFEAAERLRDELTRGGLDVTWEAFEGGHEIPLIVLRRLKRFLSTYAPAVAAR